MAQILTKLNRQLKSRRTRSLTNSYSNASSVIKEKQNAWQRNKVTG